MVRSRPTYRPHPCAAAPVHPSGAPGGTRPSHETPPPSLGQCAPPPTPTIASPRARLATALETREKTRTADVPTMAGSALGASYRAAARYAHCTVGSAVHRRLTSRVSPGPQPVKFSSFSYSCPRLTVLVNVSSHLQNSSLVLPPARLPELPCSLAPGRARGQDPFVPA